MLGRARRAAHLAAVNLLVLAAALLATEGALRLFGVHFPAIPRVVFGSVLWRHDPVTGWSHVPGSQGRVDLGGPDSGHVRINSLGFRGREVAPRKGPGVVRVLALGDSFVFGIGVDEEHTFTSRLESRLRDLTGQPHEVVNMGVAGYSTDQELLLFRERGLALSPDVVLLVVCDNDFEGNAQSFMYLRYYKPYFTIAADGSLLAGNLPVPRLTAGQRARAWLGQRSVLWNFVRSRDASWPPLRRLLDGFEVDVSRVSADDPVRLTYLLIREIRDLAEGVGARFLTVNTGERAEQTRLFVALRRHLRGAGIAFLGLEGPLSAARDGEPDKRWDFGKDHHWNVDAHRLAAEIVAERLAAPRGPGRPSTP
ncbi:MAG TPA: SGNH/GDSL hydrolase family protein [Vicinamibacteria bacterium]|nr:SGNH/GDSL hydrolase family protein [Vicinamibacteria bacterium]